MGRTVMDRLDRLQLDVDLRLREPWQLAFDVSENLDSWDLEMVGMLMRAAYARGYVDAHTEAVPAQLYREHGYSLPKRAEIG